MRFEFATASRIIFGPGTAAELPPLAKAMGDRVFLITGKKVNRTAPLREFLREAGLKTVAFAIPGEPTVSMVSQGAETAREEGCDLVIGLGGGSVIDAAKAVAALATNKEDVFEYLEVIGRGKPLRHDPIPCIALPTTAGTGAEVTQNSVLASPEHRVKVSLRHPKMLPDLAVIDPVLTYSMPADVTASTGLDALTQLLESFVTQKANPITDALCRDGLMRASCGLRRAFNDGKDAEARQDMSLASLFSGLALANAKLGAVHGMAGPMGGMFTAPHGVICARLLPWVMEANLKALRNRGPGEILGRFDEIASIVTHSSDAKAEDGIAWIQGLCRDLNVPPLSEFGVTEDQFAEIVSRANKASSMKGNPVVLTKDEMIDVLTRAVGSDN
jgi:alcohol dehydrogenase class IV